MDPKTLTKTYSNGEITVVWQPALCIHSTICWRGHESLPVVFDPRLKPWIRLENSQTDRIVVQVKRCPSGALSVLYDNALPENGG